VALLIPVYLGCDAGPPSWGRRWRAMDCRPAGRWRMGSNRQEQAGGCSSKRVAPGGAKRPAGKRPLARVVVPSPFPANGRIITEVRDQVIANPTYSWHPDRSLGTGCVRRIEWLADCRSINTCHDLPASSAVGPCGPPRHLRPSLPKSGAARGAGRLSTMIVACTIGASSQGARPGWGSPQRVRSVEPRTAERQNVAGSALPEGIPAACGPSRARSTGIGADPQQY
jgi:hypothetical protein